MAMALFPGSFDPFHLGHLWIVEWAAGNYDEVVVGVLGNPDKPSGMFSPDERVRLASLATEHLQNVRCLAFHGLTGSLAQEQHADVIVRSAHKEADTERLLAVINRFMSRGVPTRFAPSNPLLEGISSSTVRDLIESGDTDGALELVPEAMRAHLPSASRLDAAARSRPAGGGTLTMDQRVNPLRVAAVQDAPVFLDRDATLDKTLTLVERAAGTGAQLVVFPEAFIAGYPDWVWRTTPVDEHASALYARLFDNAVVVGSAVTQVLGLAAQRYGVYLSIGITERETVGSTLYSTQLLFGPDGALAAVHRKLIPSGAERLVWGMGDGSGLAVVETPFGRIGTLTHEENYMPLARAALYAARRRHLSGTDVERCSGLAEYFAAHRRRGWRLCRGCEPVPAGLSGARGSPWTPNALRHRRLARTRQHRDRGSDRAATDRPLDRGDRYCHRRP